MNKELHVAGRFWLADNASNTLGGYIEFAEDGPRIRLVGGFGERMILEDVIIHGLLTGQSSQEVTLFNCFGSSTWTSTNAEYQASETSITSTLAVFGDYFNSYDKLVGIGIEFRLPHVATWFHHDCFNTEFDFETRKATVTYSAYEEREFQAADGVMLTLVYKGVFYAGGWGIEELKIHRPLWLRISTRSPVGYDELRSLASWYQRLFSWLLDRKLPFSEFALMRQSEEVQTPYNIHRVIESRTPEIADGERFSFTDCLLEYPKIQEHFPALLSNWHRLTYEHRDSLEGFFGMLVHPEIGVEHQFLSVCAACEELLHKSSGQEFKFRKVLQELCERWHDCMDSPPSNELIEQLVNARHYFAHRTYKRSKKAARGFLLWRYTYFLRALYSLELLQLLGMPRKEISNLVAYNYSLREKLNRRYFPSIEDTSDTRP